MPDEEFRYIQEILLRIIDENDALSSQTKRLIDESLELIERTRKADLYSISRAK